MRTPELRRLDLGASAFAMPTVWKALNRLFLPRLQALSLKLCRLVFLGHLEQQLGGGGGGTLPPPRATAEYSHIYHALHGVAADGELAGGGGAPLGAFCM